MNFRESFVLIKKQGRVVEMRINIQIGEKRNFCKDFLYNSRYGKAKISISGDRVTLSSDGSGGRKKYLSKMNGFPEEIILLKT